MTKSNKLIILDLDATLISAQSLEKFEKDPKNKKKLSKFNKHFRMENYYHVIARPHLDVFLDYIFSNFKVAVWTAASQMYALSIIQQFIMNKPGRDLEFILFDYHNEHSMKHGKGTKDLEFLRSPYYGISGYDNMVILDDYDEVLKVNPKNSIKAPFFDFKSRSSHNDSWMLRVIPRLKRFKNARVRKAKKEVKDKDS
jgi:TFIIF-interacting CTD phosphatase-like protein